MISFLNRYSRDIMFGYLYVMTSTDGFFGNLFVSHTTNCLGRVYWDHDGKHVSICSALSLSNCPMPTIQLSWNRECVGARRAPAQKFARCVPDSNSETEDAPTEEGSQEVPQDMFYRCVSAQVAANQCKARTYDLWECLTTPISRKAFCGIHTKHESLRHGRVENPIPRKLRDDFFRTGDKHI